MDTAGGNSALGQAVLLGLEIEAVQRQVGELTRTARALRQQQHRWQVGGTGELGVVAALVGMDQAGWHVLPDRRWPGTTRANIDVLVVGPGGVFVIDVKTWQEVRLERGRLWRGDADADDEVDRLRRQGEAVETLLAGEGLPPTEVVPLLVLAGRAGVRGAVGRVQVVGELELALDLGRRGLRLPPDAVEQLVEALARGCPPMPVPPSPAPRRPREVPAEPPALFDRGQLWDELLAAAAREPVETWMSWLHPSQARQVKRRWSGPARIGGAAGTGKTVLALHRAKYLAAQGDAVLVTSFVRTLLPVYRSLFARLAPDLTDRVAFTPLHQLAIRLLRAAAPGAAPVVDPAVADTCFNRAWAAERTGSALAALHPSADYWHDEITHVIKGRGLTTFEQYAGLARIGRRTALQPTHREAVWRLFEEYERLRIGAGVLDWADVLRQARDLVRLGAGPRFDAVIVDEVQDLSIVGLQLLQGLLRREADGLLLVGDGQQSIYPGGFTLAEAGVSVTGRSIVLDRNYRNAGAVLRYAQSVVGDDPFDDLESEPVHGLREVAVVRQGGQVVHAPPCRPEHQAMVLATHVRGLRDTGVRLGDLAVLVPTNSLVERWLRDLQDEGLPVSRLADYDGTRSDAVKVGTFHRAKGLEFGHVLIPDRDRWPAPRRSTESAQAHQERVELANRQLFVALVRARDGLWLGATS